MKDKKFISVFIFFVVFITHFLSYNVTSFDSRWTIFTAKSILSEGNIDLNEYNSEIEENKFHGIYEMNGKFYNYFPVGTVIIALPFVAVYDAVVFHALENFPSVKEYIKSRSRQPISKFDAVGLYHGLELFIACLIIGFTSVIIYKISRLKLEVSYSILVVFIFSFCTSAWSIASRGLWQHGPSMLLLSWSLYLILICKEKPALIKYSALLLSYSCIVRPLNILSLLILGIYFYIVYRKFFGKFILLGSTPIILFLFLNIFVYGKILSPYYFDQLNIFGGTVYKFNYFEPLAANLISPARGLFVFSPVLLFSIYGAYLKFRRKKLTLLDKLLIVIVILHFISISTFTNWWGGHSFGPRFFSDMLPYFVYFLIPVFQFLPTFGSIKKNIVYSVLFITILISFYIHYKGAFYRNVWVDWSMYPSDIDQNPQRVWDWNDLQFFR